MLRIGAEEGAHFIHDYVCVFFEREVARIKKIEVYVFDVALIGFSTRCDEDRVIRAPDNQHWWLVVTQVLLPLRVGCDVGLIVV